MHSANWVLIAVAFLLGLVLTFALMIRRIEREVPVDAPAAESESVGEESVGEESAGEESAGEESAPATDTPAADADDETP